MPLCVFTVECTTGECFKSGNFSAALRDDIIAFEKNDSLAKSSPPLPPLSIPTLQARAWHNTCVFLLTVDGVKSRHASNDDKAENDSEEKGTKAGAGNNNKDKRDKEEVVRGRKGGKWLQKV